MLLVTSSFDISDHFLFSEAEGLLPALLLFDVVGGANGGIRLRISS